MMQPTHKDASKAMERTERLGEANTNIEKLEGVSINVKDTTIGENRDKTFHPTPLSTKLRRMLNKKLTLLMTQKGKFNLHKGG